MKLFEKWVRRIANDEIERYFTSVSEFNRRALEAAERQKQKNPKRSAT